MGERDRLDHLPALRVVDDATTNHAPEMRAKRAVLDDLQRRLLSAPGRGDPDRGRVPMPEHRRHTTSDAESPSEGLLAGFADAFAFEAFFSAFASLAFFSAFAFAFTSRGLPTMWRAMCRM